MFNYVCLTGRLTHSPELRTTPNGVSVCNFSIAVNRDYKSDDGNFVCDFINLVAWRSTAEFVCKYFTKGNLIGIQGSLENNNFVDSFNVTHRSFVVNVDDVHFIGK